MKGILLWTSLLIVLIGTGCTHHSRLRADSLYLDSIETADSVLVLEPPMRKGAFNYDSIIDSVFYLPLSTNDTVLISNISDIKIWKNTIFIADYKLSKIFSFDFSGNIIGCIDACGDGPEEYRRINGFDIDRRNDLLYLLDGDLGKIHVYDTSLHLCQIIKLPVSCVDHIALCGDDKVYLERGFREYDDDDNKTPNLILYNLQTNRVEYACFYFENSAGIYYRNQDPVAFSYSYGQLYYWPVLGSAIYSCTDRGLKKVIDVDLGEYKTPPSVMGEKISKAMALMRQHNYAYVDRFYDFENWIYLRISRINSSAHYFYNKCSKKGYLDLSFLNSKNGHKMIAPDLFFVSDNLCCGYMSPELYLSLSEQKTVDVENNPILVFYQLIP